MTKLSTFLLTLLTTLTVHAKLQSIEIKETLDNARSIKTIVVYSYSDSTMFYGHLNSTDTLTIGCKVRTFSESFRLELISNRIRKETDLAGKWPEIGDTT